MGFIGHPCRPLFDSRFRAALSLMTVLAPAWSIPVNRPGNNPCSTLQAFRGVSVFSQAALLLLCWANNHYPRPGLKVVINICKLALLPTVSRDKAFLVIVMQFSIGKMIERRQNSITVYQIHRTGYHFRNQWTTLI